MYMWWFRSFKTINKKSNDGVVPQSTMNHLFYNASLVLITVLQDRGQDSVTTGDAIQVAVLAVRLTGTF